ncbi:hypothetical protein HDZ31DRAFT_44120 [Schizophyllum fasciatum]
MKRNPVPEFSNPRPSKRQQLDPAARNTPVKSSPACFPTPDGFITSSKSKKPKARIYSETFQSGFSTSSSSKEQCPPRALPPPAAPSITPAKRKTLHPLKPSSLVNPFLHGDAPSPEVQKKQRTRTVDLQCETPVKSLPAHHFAFATPTANAVTPRKPIPIPPPPGSAKRTPRLKPLTIPPAPLPETPPKFNRTILTTSVARATEFGTDACNAEVASLLLQSHAVIPYHPLTEEERGLFRSPSKKDGVRPGRHVHGGLAARAASLISSTQAAVALWQTDIERQIASSAKSAATSAKHASTSGKPPSRVMGKLAQATPKCGRSTSTPFKPASAVGEITSAADKPASRGASARLHPDLRLRIVRIIQPPMPSKGTYAGNLPDKWTAGIALCELLPNASVPATISAPAAIHSPPSHDSSASSTPHKCSSPTSASTPPLITAILAFDAREPAYDAQRQAAHDARAREARCAAVREAAAFCAGREVLVWRGLWAGGVGADEGRGARVGEELRKQQGPPARPPVRAPQPPPFAFMHSSQESGSSQGSQAAAGPSQGAAGSKQGVEEEIIPERTVFCTRFVIMPDPKLGSAAVVAGR